MQRLKPPYRADHVGSLLRSTALKEARAKREQGSITAQDLKAIEDREIAALIAKQEAAGLKSITDGEYRRASWQTDFLVALDGVESYVGERKFKFQGPQPRPILLRINKKLGDYVPHPMIEHFKFVQSKTSRTAKMTIPSPSTLHFRYARDAVLESIYPAMDDFYRDLGTTYRKAVRAFADAGCRYLQLDEVNLAYLCDPNLRQQVTARGDDADKLIDVYADMINAAMSDIPSDMTITMHLCRGNFRSTFVASGAMSRSPTCCSTRSTSTVTSWNTTANAPAVSNRYVSFLRPRPSCSVSSPPRPGSSKAATRSSAASRKQRNSSISINWRSRRNAVLPRPRKEMFGRRRAVGETADDCRGCGGGLGVASWTAVCCNELRMVV